MSKVDDGTRLKWEEQLNYEELPSWDECRKFLNKRFQSLSAEDNSPHKKVGTVKPNFVKKPNSKGSFVVSNSNSSGPDLSCIFCKACNHGLHACTSFKDLAVDKRFNFVKNASLCINCLRKGHSVSRCNSSKCKICFRPHHTLLHKYSVSSNLSNQLQNNSTNLTTLEGIQPNSSVNSIHVSSNEHVILATAIILVKKQNGEYSFAKALLDSGSQVNCMTSELAQSLHLKHECKSTDLLGIGNSKSLVKFQVTTTVKSRVSDFQFTSQFLVMKSISYSNPDRSLQAFKSSMPDEIQLADPYFFKTQRIDILLGAETFFDLLAEGCIKIGDNWPTLKNTQFGWIVSGKYMPKSYLSTKGCCVVLKDDGEEDINNLLRKFWELEEVSGTQSFMTDEQLLCEKHFLDHISRAPLGRCVVSLPFKQSPSILGNSYEVAKRRFLSLERRLLKDKALRELYMQFMEEYLSLGHMTQVSEEVMSSPHFVIPHQCVLRPDSLTTKLRVVFDASSKSTSQVSLNDILMVGATVQSDLYSILLRFRLNRFAITADITKMYRQIEIDVKDRQFQLILWRRNPTDSLGIFQLNTVTYGTASAPFLATRVLTYLSDVYDHMYPIGASVIRKSFYVDDLLAGADSVEELEEIRRQVTQLLHLAQIPLAKWYSNVSSHDNSGYVDFNKTETTKTLGVKWIQSRDCFQFSFDYNDVETAATKRNILSISSRMFDPLGLLSPLIIVVKIFMQELWLHNLEWDQPIPDTLANEWQRLKARLQSINAIEIPRFVDTTKAATIDIHGFADASQRAYGCCIYVRATTDCTVKVHLLTAKSKVAPLKTKSLPRLELCAAHMLAKLWSKVQHLFSFTVDNVYFWSDSEIVLYWLQTHPSTLSTFVGNRVSDIQDRTQSAHWRYVPSRENPADIVSRGCTVEELTHSMWLTGPKFLTMNSSAWPSNPKLELSCDKKRLEVRKQKNVFFTQTNEKNPIIEIIARFSSYKKLLRVFSYVLRWRYRKTLLGANLPSPSASELHLAFLKLASVVQTDAYGEIMLKYEKCQKLPTLFQRLNPFIQKFSQDNLSFSLFRVGGRLYEAPISIDAKFPLLMPKDSHFVKIYLTHLHLENSMLELKF